MMDEIRKASDKNLISILRNVLFDLMLTIEILIVIIDKSALHFSYEGQVFRITFLINVIIVILGIYEGFKDNPGDVKKGITGFYSLWQWGLLLVVGLIAVIDYKTSGRNEMLRFLMVIATCRKLDVTKKLKIFFFETLGGCTILVLLSLLGILGEVQKLSGTTGQMQYVLGMGDPNALHCMFLMIVLLAIYLYMDKMKWYHYLALVIADIILWRMTGSEIGAGVTLLAIIAAVIVQVTRIKDYKFPYITGIVLLIFEILFSIWSACLSVYSIGQSQSSAMDELRAMGREAVLIDYWLEDILKLVNRILTGRITYLYWGNEHHQGAIYSWHLFADDKYEIYYDMGFCRLFFWYGWIPAFCVIGLIIFVYIFAMFKKDGKTLVVLSCMCIYTVVEAHLVSVYAGRNFGLLLMGLYIMNLAREEHGNERG
ncbi:hypothetical protein [Butyrivibrio fibrisolvens]|uniref:hypothetical protein n=1 Tax=Butyrivibrio fibrisolvens TaxID=831 RepID=UPI00041BE7ED|nr:hypothetical protein [Butyrivibrio fibrisolvens]